jgi:hypothetical protein
LDRRLEGPQSLSERCKGKKKQFLGPYWKPNPGHPACSQSLYRLKIHHENVGNSVNITDLVGNVWNTGGNEKFDKCTHPCNGSIPKIVSITFSGVQIDNYFKFKGFSISVST